MPNIPLFNVDIDVSHFIANGFAGGRVQLNTQQIGYGLAVVGSLYDVQLTFNAAQVVSTLYDVVVSSTSSGIAVEVTFLYGRVSPFSGVPIFEQLALMGQGLIPFITRSFLRNQPVDSSIRMIVNSSQRPLGWRFELDDGIPIEGRVPCSMAFLTILPLNDV